MFWNFFFCLLWHIIGARYYDAELGIWLSVDAAEQFANAYAYAGNGANPVIMVDKDGNSILAILGIIVGTYMVAKGVSNVVHNWEGIKENCHGIGCAGMVTGVFALGMYEGAVDLTALTYTYLTPPGLIGHFSGANIANKYIFAPLGGTFDYLSHGIAFNDWSWEDYKIALFEFQYYYSGGLAGFLTHAAVDGERFSKTEREKDRYKMIRAKMAGCVQDAPGPDRGSSVSPNSAEWYSNSFNSSYQTQEQNSSWQKYHKAGGRLMTAAGWLGSLRPNGAERNFYYGFELFGEPWEPWSLPDLQDDTQWERTPGSVKDWRAKHNLGCYKYGLK